jgi:predicted lipoprotein with Yx(FWY)xxD motif
MKKILSIFVLFGILAILITSGCTQQQPAVQQTPAKETPKEKPEEQPAIEQPTVKLSSGNYIVDEKGNTLYLFTKDVMGDSKCTGTCLTSWPVFYQEKITVLSGLISSDFGTITRDDGKKQTTYKGWPLYYFSSDVNPGDIKGEGVNKVWFIARPDYTVFIADKDNMKFIVDAKGITLYNFTKDMPGVSNCKGNCLKIWPVFYGENIVAPSMMNTSDFGVITNSEGSKQTTYKQMPLHYYVNDTKRGDTNGENVNNAWFIIEPDQVAAVPTTTTQSSAATSSVPAIKVTSFPSSSHGDTNITIRWEVSGGTPGNISNTAILWGDKSGSASISDYSKATVIQKGKTLQQFSTGIIIPPSGTIYFRAHAIVDGTDVFSQEYQISIIVQTSGY